MSFYGIVDLLCLSSAHQHRGDIGIGHCPRHGKAYHGLTDFLRLFTQGTDHGEVIFVEVNIGMSGDDMKPGSFGEIVAIGCVLSSQESRGKGTVGRGGNLLLPTQGEEFVFGFWSGETIGRLENFEAGITVTFATL